MLSLNFLGELYFTDADNNGFFIFILKKNIASTTKNMQGINIIMLTDKTFSSEKKTPKIE